MSFPRKFNCNVMLRENFFSFRYIWWSRHGCWYLLSFNTCSRCLQLNCQTDWKSRRAEAAKLLWVQPYCRGCRSSRLNCRWAQMRSWWMWTHSAWLIVRTISTEQKLWCCLPTTLQSVTSCCKDVYVLKQTITFLPIAQHVWSKNNEPWCCQKKKKKIH